MFAGHFRWDPAMELVKESPPPLIPAKAGTGHAIKRGLCGVPDITRIAANGSIFIRSDGTAGAFGDLCEPGGHLASPAHPVKTLDLLARVFLLVMLPSP